ncbi:unnamed protein product [Effrenium voratum]|nr:unnamed protein product [Effrenium voratum]
MTVSRRQQENEPGKDRNTEEKVALLKDVLPSRSRWADIEVEDAISEADYDDGTRADEKLAGRRQLGPRGGRRPKFPAESKVQPMPITEASAKYEINKPYLQVPEFQDWGYGMAWGMDWGYGTYETEWPSRADMDNSWRRKSNDNEGWGRSPWGEGDYKRPGRDRGWY